MRKLSITFRVSARLLWVKEIDGRLTPCGLRSGLVWRQNVTLYGLRHPPLVRRRLAPKGPPLTSAFCPMLLPSRTLRRLVQSK